MLVRSNRGFTLVEMLLAMSVWFILCTTLLPQLMVIITERKNTEIANMGNQLLAEELQKGYNGEILLENNKINKDDVMYQFSKTFNEEIEKWELCITWEDKLSKSFERCGYMNEK